MPPSHTEHLEPRSGQFDCPVVEHSVVGPPLSVVSTTSVSSNMPRARSAAVTLPRPSSRAEIMPAKTRRPSSLMRVAYGAT